MARFVRRYVGAAILLAGVATLSAQRSAAVRGVVRDAEGTPQMGVAVQLLSGDAQVVAAAFTDLNGRYLMRNLVPGMYQLRATATLSMPVLRSRLQLRPGDLPTINVTMGGLLGAPWLAVSQRHAEDQPDDWRWTLRSSANRPLLRIFDDDPASGHGGPERPSGAPEMKRTASIGQTRGTFGNSGVRFAAQERRASSDRLALSSARGEVLHAGEGSVTADLATVFEAKATPSSTRRAAVHFTTRPQVGFAGQGSGLAMLDASAGEQFMVGDFARIEAGTLLRAIRSGQTAIASYPFLRIETQAPSGWMAGYAMASSAECQDLSDVGRPLESVPTVGMVGGRLRPEQGLHQAVFLRRKVGKAVLQATYERDALRTVSVGGIGSRGVTSMVKVGTPQQQTASGVLPIRLVDNSNGVFRELHEGYTADGWHVLVSYPVTPATKVSTEYVSGEGLAAHPGVPRAGAANILGRDEAQSLRVAVNTAVRRTGTRLAAGYGWQTKTLVTPLSRFGSDQDGSYLYVHVQQTLPAGHVLPQGTVLSVDGNNLAGQGYIVLAARDATSPSILASTLRSLQASLNFTF